MNKNDYRYKNMDDLRLKYRIKEAFFFRFWAIRGWLQGNINFRHLVIVFLPSWLRRPNMKLELFGHPFVYSLLSDALGEFQQIVIGNQYHLELAKGKGAIVDAGCNIGGFAICAAHKNPEVMVYAFEPTPETFKMLLENTKWYKNIKCFPYALGEKERMVSIVRHPNGSPGSNYVGEGGTPVEMKTIDSFGFDMQFLKMDVEGFEANVLKGAAETIKKYKPVIAMSAYHKPEDMTELPKVLNSIAPYDCEFKHEQEPLFVCKPK
jgi:FkbM family methyltransferase